MFISVPKDIVVELKIIAKDIFINDLLMQIIRWQVILSRIEKQTKEDES